MQENRVALAESASDREVSVREPATRERGTHCQGRVCRCAATGQASKSARTRELLFDSFLQPLAQGARSSGSEIRQMLYRADPYQVDVHIEATPGASKLVVMGSCWTAEPGRSRARCPGDHLEPARARGADGD